MAKVNIKTLREALNYDPESGRFTWAKQQSPAVKMGQSAGCVMRSTGYLVIGFEGTLHRAHRLAWAYVHGKAPEGHIDHINRNKTDNRISNLRCVSASENSQNILRIRRGKVQHGIDFNSRTNRYRARISVDGRRLCLGHFATADEAQATYIAAKLRMHPAFSSHTPN
jgi:hypothetical protein